MVEITKKYLLRVIKEEVRLTLQEDVDDCPPGTGLIVQVNLSGGDECSACTETTKFLEQLPWKFESYDVDARERRLELFPMARMAMGIVDEWVSAGFIKARGNVVVVAIPNVKNFRAWDAFEAWVFTGGLDTPKKKRYFMDRMLSDRIPNRTKKINLQYKPGVKCGGGGGRRRRRYIA